LSDCEASSITITRDTRNDKKVAERLRSVRRGILKTKARSSPLKERGEL
jgi:hypothetical protein